MEALLVGCVQDPLRALVVEASVVMARFGIPPPNDNKPMPINWRRGLFRVWLLISIAWIMGWSVHLIMFGIRGGFKDVDNLIVAPVLLFGPPIALFLFGAVARWAFQGFAPDRE